MALSSKRLDDPTPTQVIRGGALTPKVLEASENPRTDGPQDGVRSNLAIASASFVYRNRATSDQPHLARISEGVDLTLAWAYFQGSHPIPPTVTL
jgi:hypothetical protein